MKEEPVDVLDEQGNKTGQVLLKSEAHKKGLWHPVAHLWIYNSEGKVLMQKRAPEKLVWPNLWDVAVAGHIAAGDSAESTVIREALEELGIKVGHNQIKFIGNTNFEYEMPGGWMNRIFIWPYITEIDLDIAGLTLEKEEVSEVKWIALDKLEEMFSSPSKAMNFSPDLGKYFKTALTEIRKGIKNSG